MDSVDYQLTVPSDLDRMELLETKKEEYERRIERTGNAYTAPELKGVMNPDATHKLAILSRLLDKGQVSSFALSLELYEELGDAFDSTSFNTAFAVIRDYAETGGLNVCKGRGL